MEHPRPPGSTSGGGCPRPHVPEDQREPKPNKNIHLGCVFVPLVTEVLTPAGPPGPEWAPNVRNGRARTPVAINRRSFVAFEATAPPTPQRTRDRHALPGQLQPGIRGVRVWACDLRAEWAVPVCRRPRMRTRTRGFARLLRTYWDLSPYAEASQKESPMRRPPTGVWRGRPETRPVVSRTVWSGRRRSTGLSPTAWTSQVPAGELGRRGRAHRPHAEGRRRLRGLLLLPPQAGVPARPSGPLPGGIHTRSLINEVPAIDPHPLRRTSEAQAPGQGGDDGSRPRDLAVKAWGPSHVGRC